MVLGSSPIKKMTPLRPVAIILSTSIIASLGIALLGRWQWDGGEGGGAPLGPPPRPCLGQTGAINRSLVIVVHGGKTGYDYAQEWSNLDYFMRNGMSDAGTDYVFVLPSLEAEWWPARYRNLSGRVSFIRAPRACPCDLCAHALALKGMEGLETDYTTIVFFNTGARGPYPIGGGAGWMDRLRGYTHNGMAVSNTIVWEGRCYVPSYFIAMPSCVVSYVRDMWHETCHEGGNMDDCAMRGEFTLLPFLNWLGVPVHITSRNLTIYSEKDCADNEPDPVPWFLWGRRTNPDFWPVDLNRSMFLKYGGGLYRRRFVHPSVVREVQRRG